MRSLVANAADPDQVKEAEKTIKERKHFHKDGLKKVLATHEGRAFLWRLLKHCKVFESIYHPSALIHHNSGKQDVGHFIMSEIVTANEDALLLMMKESKEGLYE